MAFQEPTLWWRHRPNHFPIGAALVPRSGVETARHDWKTLANSPLEVNQKITFYDLPR
jgi:hypothetical protein